MKFIKFIARRNPVRVPVFPRQEIQPQGDNRRSFLQSWNTEKADSVSLLSLLSRDSRNYKEFPYLDKNFVWKRAIEGTFFVVLFNGTTYSIITGMPLFVKRERSKQTQQGVLLQGRDPQPPPLPEGTSSSSVPFLKSLWPLMEQEDQ